MSFFGLEQDDLLEREKQAYLEQQRLGGHGQGQGQRVGGGHGDVPEYTWGEDSYDGLADQLIEGGDDFNDETFGGSGPVGKDFDFAGQTIGHAGIDEYGGRSINNVKNIGQEAGYRGYGQQQQQPPQQQARPEMQSTGSSRWEDQSTFSVLGRMDRETNNSMSTHRSLPAPNNFTNSHSQSPSLYNASPSMGPASKAAFSPFDTPLDESLAGMSMNDYGRAPRAGGGGIMGSAQGRSVQEIEEEMRLLQRQRLLAAQAQAQAQQSQQQSSPYVSQRQLPPQSMQQARLQEQQFLLQQQQQQQQQQQYFGTSISSPALGQHRHSPSYGHLNQQQPIRTGSPLTRVPDSYSSSQLLAQQQALAGAGGVRAPPPRMHPHSASPRFHQMQQEIQINRQQEQYKLQWLNKQLQREQEERIGLDPSISGQDQFVGSQGMGPGEMGIGDSLGGVDEDRRRLEQMTALEFQAAREREARRLAPGSVPSPALGPAAIDLRVAEELATLRRHSPAFDPHLQIPPDAASQHLPDSIQIQQLILHRQAKEKFMREMVGHEQVGQRIMEAERQEEKRRIKAMKISHMARYNDLMTQSDKDFITRIQVSQLVTQDPYTEDFYAQIYVAIMRSKLGLPEADPRVLNFSNGGGVGVGVKNRPNGRRANAIAKMEAQVEKIVEAARVREQEKGTDAMNNSLQGALGKTAGRSYKTAPRQLLQVKDAIDENSGVSKQAAHTGLQALTNTSDTGFKRDAYTRREALLLVEKLYDLVGEIETMDRRPPSGEDPDAELSWTTERQRVVDQMWDQMHTSVPLEACVPHPFASIIMPAKGKRFMARLTKYLSEDRSLLLFTLLVALFPQLDVVAQAPILDTIAPSEQRAEVELQTQMWVDHIPTFIMAAVSHASLHHISGWLGLLLHRMDVVAVANTQPGLTLLTYLMSRVDAIFRELAEGTAADGLATPEDQQQWDTVYGDLFRMLTPNFLFLFPSYRVTGDTAFNPQFPPTVDARTWHFLAVFATLAPQDHRPALVTGLREKILSDLTTTRQTQWLGEEERAACLNNLNLFLNSLGLDSSQIAL